MEHEGNYFTSSISFWQFNYTENFSKIEKLFFFDVDPVNNLKSIHYKRRAFSIFTSQKSNTFVEKIQNIIGMAGV